MNFLSRRVVCYLIAALLLASTAASADRKRLLLIGQSPDNHARGTHEYMAGVRLLAGLLDHRDDLAWQVARADGDWLEGPEMLESADGVVLFVSEGAKWISADPRRLDAFAKFAARGGGLTTLHWAMGTRDAQFIDAYLQLFGGCHGGPDRRHKIVEADVHVVAPDHPATNGLDDFHVREEFYYQLKFIPGKQGITDILKADIDGRAETVCWAWERPDRGRSFGFTGGHFHDNWRHSQYRRLMAQGILWTLGLAVPDGGINVDVTDAAFKLPPQSGDD